MSTVLTTDFQEPDNVIALTAFRAQCDLVLMNVTGSVCRAVLDFIRPIKVTLGIAPTIAVLQLWHIDAGCNPFSTIQWTQSFSHIGCRCFVLLPFGGQCLHQRAMRRACNIQDYFLSISTTGKLRLKCSSPLCVTSRDGRKTGAWRGFWIPKA